MPEDLTKQPLETAIAQHNLAAVERILDSFPGASNIELIREALLQCIREVPYTLDTRGDRVMIAARLIEAIGQVSENFNTEKYSDKNALVRQAHGMYDDNRTLLDLAIEIGDAGLVEGLIEKGANVNAKREAGGYALLHLAISKLNSGARVRDDRDKIFEALLNAKNINVNVQGGPNNNTPLHQAVLSGANHSKDTLALLMHRADPTIKNRSGESPLDCAEAQLKIKKGDLTKEQKANRKTIYSDLIEVMKAMIKVMSSKKPETNPNRETKPNRARSGAVTAVQGMFGRREGAAPAPQGKDAAQRKRAVSNPELPKKRS